VAARASHFEQSNPQQAIIVPPQMPGPCPNLYHRNKFRRSRNYYAAAALCFYCIIPDNFSPYDIKAPTGSLDHSFPVTIDYLFFSETVHGVVVEHPGRLHVCVADLRPEELEAPLF
jgi:hypothetical protein